MPYGFRLKNGKLWRGDEEVGGAFGSRRSANLARSKVTGSWTGYEAIFAGSKIVRLLPLAEDNSVRKSVAHIAPLEARQPMPTPKNETRYLPDPATHVEMLRIRVASLQGKNEVVTGPAAIICSLEESADIIEKLLSERAALEWRPIADAPKDAEVLLFVPDDVLPGYVYIASYSEWSGWTDTHGATVEGPTHFRLIGPLPKVKR